MTIGACEYWGSPQAQSHVADLGGSPDVTPSNLNLAVDFAEHEEHNLPDEQRDIEGQPLPFTPAHKC